MKLLHMLKRLWHGEQGVVAPIVAVSLTAFIGLVGAGVDLGMVYSARTELQNAVDAATLAATAELVRDLDGDDIVEANYSGAEDAAQEYAGNNPLLSENLTWTSNDTFEAGLWDFGTKTFSSTGPSSNPNDLTAVRVTMNRTIDMFFTRIVGVDSINVQVQSTGYLGYAGNGGRPNVPIAVRYRKLLESDPGEDLYLNNENDENVQWTSFDRWPANKNTVEPLIDDPDSIPFMNLGDDMYMVNGVITPLMRAIEDAYEDNKDANGEWHVICPVVAWDPPQNRGILKGYVHYMITGVKVTGKDKGIKGFWADNGEIVAQGAGPGGENFGVRAGAAVLID
jgi:Flp pilus assembly protein TadG